MSFLNEFDKATTIKETENGALAYTTTDSKMVDFFSLLDVWGSKGYDRFDDGGLYVEVPMFLYENIENIPFLKTSGILIEKF